jgi:hypothetical protein
MPSQQSTRLKRCSETRLSRSSAIGESLELVRQIDRQPGKLMAYRLCGDGPQVIHRHRRKPTFKRSANGSESEPNNFSIYKRLAGRVKGGIVLALPERAALGSRSRHGAHGIARKPAHPLATQCRRKCANGAMPNALRQTDRCRAYVLMRGWLTDARRNYFRSVYP